MREKKLQWVGKKGLGWRVHIASESSSSEGNVSDDGMSEDREESGVKGDRSWMGKGIMGTMGMEGGGGEGGGKGGVWIVVGDAILWAKDMREGLQATVQADEVKVWGESGARMRDMVWLVEGQMGTVRKEGKKVEGIVLHVGTNDFGKGMNAVGMAMRAGQMG